MRMMDKEDLAVLEMRLQDTLTEHGLEGLGYEMDVKTFEEEGVLTNDLGVVVRFSNSTNSRRFKLVLTLQGYEE